MDRTDSRGAEIDREFVVSFVGLQRCRSTNAIYRRDSFSGVVLALERRTQGDLADARDGAESDSLA